MSQESPTFEAPKDPETMAKTLTAQEGETAETLNGTKKKAMKAAQFITAATGAAAAENKSDQEITQKIREFMGREQASHERPEDPSTTPSD